MKNFIKSILIYVGIPLAIYFLFSLGLDQGKRSKQKEIDSYIENHEILLEEIAVVRNENTTLLDTLETAGEQEAILLDQLASMKSKPAQIKYVTQVETIVVGEPVYITNKVPEEYTFRTATGLAVARFTYKPHDLEPEYSFDTADLTIRASVIVGEKDSSVSLTAVSNLDPSLEHELPVTNFVVDSYDNHKFFEPHLSLGAHASAVPFGWGAHVGLTPLHLRNLDLLQLRAGNTENQLTFGLDPVVWNAGNVLPVFTNIWLGAGVDLSLQKDVYGSVSLSAKL